MAAVPPFRPEEAVIVKTEPREPEDEDRGEPMAEIKPEPDLDIDDSDGTEIAEPEDDNEFLRGDHASYDSDRTENPYDDEDRIQEEEIHAFRDVKPEPTPPWAYPTPAPPSGKGRVGKPRTRRPWAPDDTVPGTQRKDPHGHVRVPRWRRMPAAEPEEESPAAPKPDIKPSPRGPKPRKASQAQDNHNFLVCARNYAAVDARRESYGLIDQGLVDAGTRTMIMHVRRGQPAWDILNTVRPGSILAARSKSGRGSPTPLRVRFTTPTKYISPGCKFSTMTVGVDEMDWQSLMAKARRI